MKTHPQLLAFIVLVALQLAAGTPKRKSDAEVDADVANLDDPCAPGLSAKERARLRAAAAKATHFATQTHNMNTEKDCPKNAKSNDYDKKYRSHALKADPPGVEGTDYWVENGVIKICYKGFNVFKDWFGLADETRDHAVPWGCRFDRHKLIADELLPAWDPLNKRDAYSALSKKTQWKNKLYDSYNVPYFDVGLGTFKLLEKIETVLGTKNAYIFKGVAACLPKNWIEPWFYNVTEVAKMETDYVAVVLTCVPALPYSSKGKALKPVGNKNTLGGRHKKVPICYKSPKKTPKKGVSDENSYMYEWQMGKARIYQLTDTAIKEQSSYAKPYDKPRFS